MLYSQPDMGRWLFAFALFATLSSAAVAQLQVQGLDHLPIVVRDLDRAAADFTALGFVLKPGRPHADGLRNVHAKFADGTELELISPGAPVDDLSRRYVDWLRQGDGPVSLGLFAPNATPPPLDGIFFDRRQKSPTDRPEHFAHPNGATTLAAVWLAGSRAERQLVEIAGRWPTDQPACAPFGTVVRVLRLPEGEIVLLPHLSGRPIVAATVAVASLDPVRRFVTRSAVDCPRSVWVETHGLWLEFRVH
jgi:hypothetical protein